MMTILALLAWKKLKMVKQFTFCIVLVALASSCRSVQESMPTTIPKEEFSLSQFNKEILVWPADESSLSVNEKMSIISDTLFPNNCFYGKPYHEFFHWVDLNRDGKFSEIVFYGGCLPYRQVDLYLPVNQKYSDAGKYVLGGILIRLEQFADRSRLWTTSEACCSALNDAKIVEVVGENPVVNRLVDWLWHFDTDISGIKSGEWKASRSFMKLRTTPKVNNKILHSYDTEELVKGNLLAIIMPGTTYRVLKKRGRWKLVEVLSKGKLKGNGLQPDMEDANEVCRMIGWVR